ncbi:hypothetical protein JCM8547_006586 [Rhodosporidiobolus lusitaniae]
MRLILTGATGVAGSEVLRQALLDPRIEAVTVLTRRPLPSHVAPTPLPPKLRVVEHSDFSSYPPSVLSDLKGHGACIWALGMSSVGVAEKDYEVVTYDYAIAAAKAFSGLRTDGEKFVFAFLSGMGADQREGKAAQMFGRVKGKTELALARLPAASPDYSSLTAYSFRPGGILPPKPIPDGSFRYRNPLFLRTMHGIGWLTPSYVISTVDLAKGMIEVALKGGKGEVAGWPGKGAEGNAGTFDNEEIKRVAKGEAAK